MAVFTIAAAVTGTTLGLGATGLALLSTATSVVYQRIRQKQMQERMEAAMDKQKGFEIAVDGEAFDLPVVYGHGKVAGGRTYYEVKSDYNAWTGLAATVDGGVREPETGDQYDESNNYFKVVQTTVPENLPTKLRNTGDNYVEVVWNGAFKTGGGSSQTSSIPTTASDLAQYDSVSGAIVGSDQSIYFHTSQVSQTTEQLYLGESGGEGNETAYYGTKTTTVYHVYRVIPETTNSYLENGLTPGTAINGSENEFLFLQQAIAYAGISEVVDVDVNDKPWNDPDYEFGQRIHIYPNGNVADPMATANLSVASPETMTFTNTAYASMVFRLNRDDYNYSGSVPSVTFYVKGMKVRTVSADGTLSTEKVYSNNPAWCLLDYLLSPIYGRGLSVDQVDLMSFYKAAVICDVVELTGQDIGGKINGVRPAEDGSEQTPVKTDIKRFECNLALDSGAPIRENIETILETMHNAELVWSAGVYKLQLNYPTSEEEENNLIAMEFTARDIIRKEINFSYPSLSEKYNQATIRFRNESKDFAEDSVSWPTRYSSVHLLYMEEDRGIESNFETFNSGITDRYHALAKAEQIVRSSRRETKLKLTVSTKGMLLEPGDLIRVIDPISGYQQDGISPADDTFRVESVKVNEDMTVAVDAVGFSYQDLAWNVDDNIGYDYTYTNTLRLPTPTNLTITINDSATIQQTANGILRWSIAPDARIEDFIIEASPIAPITPDFPVVEDPNFSQREADIFALYEEVLYRVPDQAGFDFWVNTSWTIDQIRRALYNSEEKNWRILGFSREQIFEIVGLVIGEFDFSVRARANGGTRMSYRGILSREAIGEASGVRNLTAVEDGFVAADGSYQNSILVDWDAPLIDNVKEYHVEWKVNDFDFSANGGIVTLSDTPTARETLVYKAYEEILYRQPDQAGFDFYVSGGGAGLTEDELRDQFILSAEATTLVFNGVVVNRDTTRYNITPVVDNTLYNIRVRVLEKSGVTSPWSAVTLDTRADVTNPGEPTNLQAEADFSQIRVLWNNPTDKDLKHIEVWEADTNLLVDAFEIAQTDGNTYTRTALLPLTTKYYWVRAIDFTGNQSNFVGPVSATTRQITTADLGPSIVEFDNFNTSVTDIIDVINADIAEIDQDLVDFLGGYSGSIQGLTLVDLPGVSANISVNYYTKQDTDSAIAAQISNFSSNFVNDFGLATDAEVASYTYSKSEADSAIAAQVNSFSSSFVNDYNLITTSNVTNYTFSQSEIEGFAAGVIATYSGTVGDSFATATEVSLLEGTVDGISAKFGVTVDINGSITGYQLLAGTGTPSAFNVRADQFNVSAVDGSSVAPFSVYTSGRTINGNYYPPGTYIEQAYIDGASIVDLDSSVINTDNLIVKYLDNTSNYVPDPLQPTISYAVGTKGVATNGGLTTQRYSTTLPTFLCINHVGTSASFYSNVEDSNSSKSTLQVFSGGGSGSAAIDALNLRTGGGWGQVGLSSLNGGFGFNAAAGGYYDSSNTGYLPFTGVHEGVVDNGVVLSPGDILIDSLVLASSISNSITKVELSSVQNQKAAIGIFQKERVGWQKIPAAFIDYEETILAQTAQNEIDNTVVVPPVLRVDISELISSTYLVNINAVGEGSINVCGENGNIEKGDLIVTSSLPGKGMKQSDDIIRSYTVAKARESVSFASTTEVKQVACIYLCG